MKIVQLQNPLMKLHKTLKGKLSGEDLLIRPTALDDSESLVQIKPYTSRLEIAASLDAELHMNKNGFRKRFAIYYQARTLRSYLQAILQISNFPQVK